MIKKLFFGLVILVVLVVVFVYVTKKDPVILENKFVQKIENKPLLPSIKSLPPHDIQIIKEDGRYMLRFSATHANIGRAPLDIISAPVPEGAKDHEREVFQRMATKDGQIETKSIGFFVWDAKHTHYHLTDFMEYVLVSLDNPGIKPMFQKKVTYCLRDNHSFDLKLPQAPQEKTYTTCGPESQGLSIGWSGTYGYQLPGQNIDITNLPSGRYELKIIFDPLGVISEMDRNDNIASSIIVIDSKNRTVEVEE